MPVPASPAKPVIVFDLDGTLADTAPDLIGTLNVVLAREGVPPVPLDQARELIGAGARALIERGFATAGREPTPDRLEEMFRFFLAHYGEHLLEESRLYPGAAEALDRLAADGHPLAVCTNKVEAHALKLLEGLGVAGRFAAITGRDTFPFFKPDPRHLTLTVERAGGEPGRAVMVGDSRTDIATARAAGVPVVAVTFGYTDTPVEELGPDRVIGHYDALVEAIAAVAPR